VITGTVWQLVSYTDAGGRLVAVPGRTAVTAIFGNNNRFISSAGCNRYAATYQLTDSTLAFGPLVITELPCSVPSELVAQETRFVSLLPSVGTVSVIDSRLVLKDDTGNPLLVFSPAPASSSLTGTRWSLDSYASESSGLMPVLSGTTITATFGDDARLSGSAGCNQYSTNYRVNGSTLSIGEIAMTLLYCDKPASIMDQENRVLSLFPSVTQYEMSGGRLILTNAAREKVLVFTRQ
jgi:heat shock protein HslJ